MATQVKVVRARVIHGQIVPLDTIKLPEGTEVEIHIIPQPLPPDLAEELSAWELASDEAFRIVEGVNTR